MFERSDVTGRDNRIPARAANVTGLRLGTTLTNEAGVSVATVEHLMAALAGLAVDDVTVEVDGPEVPVMDGSSAPFVDLIRHAGLQGRPAPRRGIQVLKPVTVDMQGRSASFLPALRPAIDVEIEFPHAAVGRQRYHFEITPDIFSGEIAPARTFGFKSDFDALMQAGLARGGSMDNAVVVDETGVANPEGLRFADEFARHKALDALGDLYLAGAPIIGLYQARKPGHALNNIAVRALLADETAWKMVTLRDAPASRAAAARS